MATTIYLHYISLLFLVLIAFSGVMIFFNEKRKFGLGIFFTFGLLAFYELSKLVPAIKIPEEILSIVFFLATTVMLVTTLYIGMEKAKK